MLPADSSFAIFAIFAILTPAMLRCRVRPAGPLCMYTYLNVAEGASNARLARPRQPPQDDKDAFGPRQPSWPLQQRRYRDGVGGARGGGGAVRGHSHDPLQSLHLRWQSKHGHPHRCHHGSARLHERECGRLHARRRRPRLHLLCHGSQQVGLRRHHRLRRVHRRGGGAGRQGGARWWLLLWWRLVLVCLWRLLVFNMYVCVHTYIHI